MKTLLAITATLASLVTANAQLKPSDSAFDEDAALFFHLLERSPAYAKPFNSVLKFGPDNKVYKDFAEKALANKDIVEAIDGFRTGKIIWRKTDDQWKVVVIDQTYEKEYAEAIVVINSMAIENIGK